MNTSKQTKIVEWSASQRAFHIEPLERACERNLRAFSRGSATDYIPIAVCNNDAELDAFMTVAHAYRERLQGEDTWGHIPKVMGR